MKKLLIFGNGSFARLMKWYIDNDDKREVVAFCCEEKYISDNTFCDLPIIPFEKVDNLYPKESYEILLGIGYSQMNNIRKRVFNECKAKGYKIASYFHSSTLIQTNNIGEGNIVLENTLIQPFVEVGQGNLIWYDISIAHDTVIGNFNTIAGKASLCGNVIIKDNCFIGNGSIVRDGIIINDFALVGAGTYIRKDFKEHEVISRAKDYILDGKKSTDYL